MSARSAWRPNRLSRSQPNPVSFRLVGDVLTASRQLTSASPECVWVDLADRMKRGESTALTEFYDGTCSLVYGLMVRILGEGTAAQEALVEVYARVWSRIQTLDCRRSSLLNWTILLARGVALEWPGRQAQPSRPVPHGSRHAVERALFDGKPEGDLRTALRQWRENDSLDPFTSGQEH